MKTFRDNAGRTWAVGINVAAVKRCRALLGVDIYALVDDRFQGLGKLLGDVVQLTDVLYVLCKDEADRQNLTDEDFGRAMGGDALGAAADAFVAELIDFFPDPAVRAALAKVMEAGKKVQAGLLTRIAGEVDALNLDGVLKKLIGSSGGSPGSSGSTRRRSRSAS